MRLPVDFGAPEIMGAQLPQAALKKNSKMESWEIFGEAH